MQAQRAGRDDHRRARNAQGARTIERVANADVSVMLLGASGTGKELLARGVHDASARAKGAFVAINCAAIPENLLESELFGHEKGAFTGAVKTTRARSNRPMAARCSSTKWATFRCQLAGQAAALPSGTRDRTHRLAQPIPVDTRIVCATHQNLDEMIANGSFREDLYYRLAEIVVRIPSLAERPGDAVLLARHFLTKFAGDMNPQVRAFPPMRSTPSTPGAGRAMSASWKTA
jgi:two-component system NtrC family response regulator